MSVGPDVAQLLVSRITDFQRSIKCLVSAKSSSLDPGVALLGVLRIIDGFGEARASDVAAHLGVGPSALSRHIADLHEIGFIQRRVDPLDGRAQLVALSDKGRMELDAARHRQAEIVAKALAGWDEQRASEAIELLADLSSTFIEASRAKATGKIHTEPHGGTN